MSKLGLCIVYKNWNYGSMLQSYATLLKLEELGIDYEIIRYRVKQTPLFYVKSVPRLLNKDLLYSKVRKLKKKLGKMKHPDFVANDNLRAGCFQKFQKAKFHNFTEQIDSFPKLKKFAERYQAVLVGSDQLWLPAGLATNFFNLMFVDEHITKIAYAASFGVSQIPFYQKKRTIEYLNRMEYISTREESGQKIVKRLTGRDVPVILDPTLIIEKEDWDRNIPDRNLCKKEYIFCYFLGKNQEHRRVAEELSKKTGLQIVTLRHLDEYIEEDENFGDYAPYDVGPEEFVNLIRHAAYVCTDSFHGSVFSIIHHKQFITFNRYATTDKNSRNSRIDTLFGQLGLKRRYRKDILSEMQESIDYEKVEENLLKLRRHSCEFLKNSLKGFE